MDTREFFRRYARSPLGIGTAFVAVGAAVVALLSGVGALASIGLGALALAAGLALGLATGGGQRAAEAEGDREALGRAGERAAAAAAARASLAALRLPEGEVAQARDLLVLEAGRLAEDFASRGECDPEAARAVSEGLELVNAWMRERDESATEKRFGLADANPFPRAAERTAAALREKAALVAARRAEAAGELPPADRMAIEEELK